MSIEVTVPIPQRLGILIPSTAEERMVYGSEAEAKLQQLKDRFDGTREPWKKMIKLLRADVSNRQEMAYEFKGQLPVVV